MNWIVNYSKEALKSLIENKLSEEELDGDLVKVIQKFKGGNINVNVKKMKGEQEGFYRLRVGKRRVIFSINFDKENIYIDRIDFRGSIYK